MDEKELLAVLDMSEDELQMIWLIKKEVMVGAVLQCKGRGELPCPSESLTDLAFRLSGGKIAGKKPIEYIIDALIKKLDDDSE